MSISNNTTQQFKPYVFYFDTERWSVGNTKPPSKMEEKLMNYCMNKYCSIELRTTQEDYIKRRDRAERWQKKFKGAHIIALALAILFGFTGCGGGGSSSGGADILAAEPTLEQRYTGTYQTGLFQGSLDILVSEANGVADVSFGGLDCFGVDVQLNLVVTMDRSTVQITGNPPGRFNQGLGGLAAFIGITYPVEGGAGTLELDPGSPCLSSVGTVDLRQI